MGLYDILLYMIHIDNKDGLSKLFTGYENLTPDVRRILDVASRQEGLSMENFLKTHSRFKWTDYL